MKSGFGEMMPVKGKEQLTPQIGSKRHFSGSNSSLQNSDDEDDEFADSNLDVSQTDSVNKSKEEKRRLSHTAAEQKRRNAIKVRLYLYMFRLLGQTFCPHLDFAFKFLSVYACFSFI